MTNQRLQAARRVSLTRGHFDEVSHTTHVTDGSIRVRRSPKMCFSNGVTG
jgi:hypothetical protein